MARDTLVVHRTDDADAKTSRRFTKKLREPASTPCREGRYTHAMHYETHQGVFDDLEARIVTIRDSL